MAVSDAGLVRKFSSLGIVRLIVDTVTLWWQQNGTLFSAALTFYLLLSLSPLLVLTVSIASVFFGRAAAAQQLILQVTEYFGETAGLLILDILTQVRSHSSSPLAWVLSIGLILIWSSLVFRQLKRILDLYWGVVEKKKPGQVSINFIFKNYVTPLITAITMGVLLLFSLIVITFLTILNALWIEISPLFGDLAQLAEIPMSTILRVAEIPIVWVGPTILFAILFKYLPDVSITWRDVLPGAFITSLLLGLGMRVFALYIRFRALTSPAAAAGTFIVVLLLLYYMAQIVLMGVAFTKIFTERYGSHAKVSSELAVSKRVEEEN